MIETNKKHRLRVIVVEDDAFIALDIEDVLLGADFDVIGCFSNVNDTLALLDQTRPDFAILDYNLGKETSVPIAKRLLTLSIPFMFLSGQTRDVVLEDFDDDYPVMGKPFRPSQLISEVETLVQI